MIKKIFIVAAIAIGLVFTSCNSSESELVTPEAQIPLLPPPPPVPVPEPALRLEIEGLKVLGDDFIYECWIIVNGETVSIGRFTDLEFPLITPVDSTMLNTATAFVLTIEEVGETGAAVTMPSDTKIMEGDFMGDSATLSISSIGRSEGDFTTTVPTGTFFLRTPTDETTGGANNNNDEAGIWFGTPVAGMPPTESLTLPTLEPGWKYEGWVIVADIGPLSTGTFTAFGEADDNAGEADDTTTNGTASNGPPIPGQDFLRNAPTGFTFPLDIRGQRTVITIEPDPDNDPAPFFLVPLSASIGASQAFATSVDLTFSDDTFPTGTATR